MGTRTLFPLVDMALGGTLKQRLLDQRAGGLSYEEITHLLREDGITVSSETVRKWCLDLSTPEELAG